MSSTPLPREIVKTAADQDDASAAADLDAGKDLGHPADEQYGYDEERASYNDRGARSQTPSRNASVAEHSTALQGPFEDEDYTHSASNVRFGDFANDDGEAGYVEPSEPTQLLPPPDFKPFFALIEDPETGEHHHPIVHYLFADDEDHGDILTSAALDAIHVAELGDSERSPPSPLDGGSADVQERIVLIDMAADGKTLLTASSLSPEWQALQTNISQAPSWGREEGTSDNERRLMLRIAGRVIGKRGAGGSKHGAGTMEELLQTFDRQLDGLDEVLGHDEVVPGGEAESHSRSMAGPGSA